VTLAALGLILVGSGSAQAVAIDWVTVGDPGNACDPQSQGCFGAVDYTYQVSKYEVTNAQYAEFLNAVASSDPNGLYSTRMGSDEDFGGIKRGGSSGSYIYSVESGFENKPVVFVTLYAAMRFANRLHNGQGSGDTESGAYTITAGGITANSITRNAGARILLPTEDESYKAAYYDPLAGLYYDYPTGTNVVTGCVVPGADMGNSANCWPATSPSGALTNVGAYTLSNSPSGTFDQGGNVWEWTDTIISDDGRVMRGGDWLNVAAVTGAAIQGQGTPMADDNNNIGFRVAMIPEPSTALLLTLGLVMLAVRRRRSGRSLYT
jgi:formylglycine-generating enzyme required for sulfatase activity